MKRLCVLFILYFTLRSSSSADEVESKADDMAKAIAEQNKKVEEESDAMEKAIDEKSKQVNTKEQEDKFEKASKQVDAVGDAADSKFEEKANLVNKLGTDANNAIENQAKKVEALGSQTDVAEDDASKMVDKIGKQIEKETDSTQPNSRMSISYTVQVPNEPHADQMIQKASDYDNYIRTNEAAEKLYQWPGGYEPPGDSYNQEELKSDMRLKPVATNNAEIERDASVNEGYHGPPDPRMRSNLKRLFYMRHSPFRDTYRRRLRGHHRHHRHHRHHHLRGYKGGETGLLVLPRGGPQQLSKDVQDQLEDDQLLKKASTAPFSNDEDTDMTAELKTSAAAEQDIEQQWINMNTIGSPEYAVHWPRATRKTGNIGKQQFSVVSPGEVELLQTEYPEYPNPRGLGGDFRGITRSKIKEKTAVSSKKRHHLTTPTKRNGLDKVEPSKVVVFPDSAVRGTDNSNMQIKEFRPKGGKGKWLAVHIPDHMPYPRWNIKLVASKNAAKDLQRVVGPNKASLAMEIQSILGVNEDTLNRMIAQGQNDEDDKEEDEGDDDDDDDDSDDGDDNDDDDGDDIGDPLNDGGSCDDYDDLEDKKGKKGNFSTKLRHVKMCKTKTKKTNKKIYDGSGIADLLNDENKPKIHVEQPQGFELRWEDILNSFKNFDVKRKRKICKLFELQNDVCQHAKKRRKHHFKRKLKRYLLRMLRKFLKKNKNDFEEYLSNKLKDALSGRLKPSDDGLLHIYEKNSGKMNMEDFLKDLNDGTPAQLGGPGDNRLSQTTANPDALTMDDNTVNDGVFRVTPQINSNKLAAEEDQDQSPPAAVSALNNIIHPLLNDQDNNLDEKLQTKILQEELGHVNSEQEEQDRQRKKDAALNNRLMYMFQLQNLASHKGEVTAPNGEIGGQPISVINPHRISLMQMDLPDKNPDIPLLGRSSSEPATRHAKSRSRSRVLPLRRRLSYRPRLLGSFRVRNVNGRWRPTMTRFWKRSFVSSKKHKARKIRGLRRIERKRSKRKILNSSSLGRLGVSLAHKDVRNDFHRVRS